MDSQKMQLIQGALLHDIGKVILRAGSGDTRQRHSILGADEVEKIIREDIPCQELLSCIRYHHARELSHSDLPDENLAYIACEADNISAGADRREKPEEGADDVVKGGFDFGQRLNSVYNLVRTPRVNRDTSEEFTLDAMKRSETEFVFPVSEKKAATSAEYLEVWNGLSHGLKLINWQEEAYLNSVYNLMEAYTSYIPSSTSRNEVPDISLFDHSSLTAAIASCMLDWARENGITDFRETFFRSNTEFRSKEAFLLVHADLSGIQDFIYTISSKRALKSLRGRSFYLDLILEQIADEILSNLDLCRANLLYSGGGGFYMLLPNTQKSAEALVRVESKVNEWLYDQFSIRLYLAIGWAPATANHFMDPDKVQSSGTREIFRAVSQVVSMKKTRRYQGMNLEKLFTPEIPQDGVRECSVCGCSKKLYEVQSPDPEEEAILMCESCRGLMELGRILARSTGRTNSDAGNVFCVEKKRPSGSLTMRLPALEGEAWLNARSEDSLRDQRERSDSQIIRVYSKNRRSTGLDVATHIYVGDYCYAEAAEPGRPVEMEDFVSCKSEPSGKSEGISRIAVLRADVDNLGNLFSKGFRGEEKDKQKYETLSRYAALSRSLSKFFKSHINHIASAKKRNMLLVYAGGDDIFAVGYWKDILEFAVDLRESFREYTSDKLSFSAGIGFFQVGFPISRMAEITGELVEDAAKSGNKDQIALFNMEHPGAEEEGFSHVYSWERYQEAVISKKDILVRQLHLTDSEEAVMGKAFLYKLLNLLKSADVEPNNKGKISLARLAYLLARREPSANARDDDKKNYQELRENLYTWSTNRDTRRELITAILISAFETRIREEKEHDE